MWGKTDGVAWVRCPEMIRQMATWVVLVGVGLAVATSAAAQAARPYGDAAPSHAIVPGRVISAAESPPPPIDLSGMLIPLNQIRSQVGVGALAWSSALAGQAGKLATAGAADCTWSSTKKALGSSTSIFYWGAQIRRFDGQATAQDLRPSFIVAEWRKGSDDYNPATGVCRRPGDCKTFSRIATPLSKSVGCARVMCPSQAQVWVCKFDDN
ncbi:MAG: CAP domain-containing protein [Alphaproteobacteria bacterium]